jgi:hypothetical protein
MKARKVEEKRPITAAEVMEWRGGRNKSKITDAQCEIIAIELTSMRWPSDLLTPDLSQTPEVSKDEYWDFDRATDAARTLSSDLPAMLRYWKGLLWDPETAGGHPAVQRLQRALSAAMPYIEYPFGYYEPRSGQKKPKEWHIYAVLIANLITKLLVDAGQAKPALTSNSVTVRIIFEALCRMHFPDKDMRSRPAIGAHLERWRAKYKKTRESTGW